MNPKDQDKKEEKLIAQVIGVIEDYQVRQLKRRKGK